MAPVNGSGAPVRQFNPRTREECDISLNMAISSGRLFQPTYPVRGTTDYQLDDTPHYFISTHAPREGCDARAISRLVGLRAFQPTHPARGATRVHVLLVGGIRDFNPRTPRGVRRLWDGGCIRVEVFQSTHPARGATRCPPGPPGFSPYFNPRTPRGVRRIFALSI